MPPRRAKAAVPAPNSRQTPSRRVKSAALSTPSPAAAASSMPSAGRTAAREVYETLDIRNMIYELLDRPTLFDLLRLEKNGIASAANILHKEINIQHFKKICRKSPRRDIYCAAVRVIDLSPPLNLHRTAWKTPSFESRPARFDVDVLLKDLAAWEKDFPLVHTILHEFPARQADDAYIVRLRGDRLLIDLQSSFAVDIYSTPFPDSGPILPVAPERDNITVCHTLSVRGTYALALDDPFHGDMVRRSASGDKWREWLRNIRVRDKRITNAVYRVDTHRGEAAKVFDGPISLLDTRRNENHHPLLEMSVSTIMTPPTFSSCRNLIAVVGSHLRTLDIELPILTKARNLQGVITILDDGLPNLKDLRVNIYIGSLFDIPSNTMTIADLTPPRPALRKLRRLVTNFYPKTEHDPRVAAQLLSPLGSDSCVYGLGFLRNNVFIDAFSRMVRKAKLSPLSSLSTKMEKPNPLEELGDDYRKAFR